MFKGLDPSTVKLLAGCARNVAFKAGQQIFAEGAPADAFWIVRHGRVALEVAAPGRGQLVVETVGEEAVVGWSWLFPPYRWRFDCVATSPTRAVMFDTTCFRGKLDSDPQLGYEMLSRFLPLVVERLTATRLRLLDIYGSVRSAG